MPPINIIARDVTLTAIKLASDDHYAQSAISVSTTTQSPITDALELTFTPASEGDYLVIAMCKNVSGQTTAECLIRLRANGVNDGIQFQTLHNTNDGQPWTHAQIYTALSGSQSFKIQFRTLSGGTSVSIDEQLIVALRVSDLDNDYSAEQQGASNTTSSTFQDRASAVFTPAATEHLLIGSARTRRTASTGAQEIQSILDGSATETLKTSTVTATATQEDHDYFVLAKRTLDAVSTTAKTQWRSPDGSTTVQIGRNNVIVLDLAVDGTIHLKGAKILGKTKLL